MKKIVLPAILVAMTFAPLLAVSADKPKLKVNPKALAELRLPFLGTPEQRQYLGIARQDSVSLSEIRAERLFIVVLNSYCTICQTDAPILKFIYEMIEADPKLRGRTKIVGIATGNNDLEVREFCKKFGIPFPVLVDQRFSLDKAVPDNLRTPMVITAKLRTDRSIEVLQTHFGQINDVDKLFDERFRSASLASDRLASKISNANWK